MDDGGGGNDSDETMVYWATMRGADLASAIKDKEEQYFQSARLRGVLQMWIIAYAGHHGLTPEDLRDFATQQIGFTGNELENLRFHINLVRSYARQQTTLALGEDANFKAMVVNSDHRSQARVEIVDRILNGMYKQVCAKFDGKVGESDSVFGSGGTHTRWDFDGGDTMLIDQPVPQETGRCHVQPPILAALLLVAHYAASPDLS